MAQLVIDYAEWEQSVPQSISSDALWRVEAYRLALYATDIAWHDVTKLGQDRRTVSLADQLYRALGSISANVAEGYSRESDKEKARFYEYAHGSAREARDWYFKARHLLGEEACNDRIDRLTQITRLLNVMVRDRRNRVVKEAQAIYEADAGEMA
ncbi:MAG: four helix bundle protein [Oscillochloris sp.]|nr:four helix bundle protein [Oscillochloris sp.]